MAKFCQALDDGKLCGGTSHIVIRPTRGGPRAAICYDHQRKLARGEKVNTRRGEVFLPQASRTRARIMRGG